MIYLRSYVFDNDRSNASFHDEQLPAIAARNGFGWMFSRTSTGSNQVKTFTQKKKYKNKTNNSKNNSKLSFLVLFSQRDRSLP